MTTSTTAATTTTTTNAVVSLPTWSRVPHDEAVFGGAGNQVMDSVTRGGPGLVAIGGDFSDGEWDIAVWTSPDGITWSRVPHEEAVFGGEGATAIWGVTAGGPGLVAVGSAGPRDDSHAAVWTSPDGITWSRVPHDEAVFGGPGTQDMNSVTQGGPGLVAVGSAGPLNDSHAAVWTSPDGITWSRVPHDEAVFGGKGEQWMRSVTAGGPGLVAVGYEWFEHAAVWTSPDGITWSRVPHDEAVFGGKGSQAMNSVTAGGPGLVAVGSDVSDGDADAAVWTSPDGITWSRVPHDEAVFGGDGGQRMYSVTVADSGLVAVGSGWSNGDDIAAVWAATSE